MPSTLGAGLEEAMRLHRRRPAVVWGPETMSYGDLDESTARIAAALAGRGIRSQQRVGLFMSNRPEVLLLDIAIARLGAVKVPINYLLPAATVAHIVGHAELSALVVTSDLAETVAAALAEVESELELIVADDANLPAAARLGDLVEAVDGPPPASDATADDLAAIFYTGGTTGKPKGVVHTQASVVAFHFSQMINAEIKDDDRLLLMTPLAHAAGLFAQTALLRGATIVLRDGFDPDAALKALTEDDVSWTFLVPTMLYRMLDAMAGRDVDPGRLRTIVYGAAPISPERLQEAIRSFGQVFVQLYGQTECPNWGTRLAKRDHDPGRPDLLSSCGQPAAMAEVRVVDEDGTDLPVGEIGEICLRAPYTLARYHRNPEATEAKFLGDFIRTGDLGLLDEDGYLYLKDRRADMVISGGMNIYCSEVEEALREHPAVGDAAVIGVPDPDWGEAVHAVVVRGAGDLSAEELLAFVRPRVAGYARPKSVEFVSALPETPFGKVDKKALRDPHWKDRQRAIN